MIFLLFVLVRSKNSWEDPLTGLVYDWSDLSLDNDNYYEIRDTVSYFVPSVYNFNFGKNLLTTCEGQYVSATESIEIASGYLEDCSIIGRSDMESVRSISNGIEITYGGGDLCFSFESLDSREISFRLICSKSEGQWEFVQTVAEDYCHIVLKKKTPSGCAQEISLN